MSVKEKFLRYVRIDTQSNPQTGAHPSTVKQFDLANVLVKELEEIGLSNVRVDEHCYVYAELPANQENLPALGFIAHLDTEPVCSGKDVQPEIVKYDGGDILGNPCKTKARQAVYPLFAHGKGNTKRKKDGNPRGRNRCRRYFVAFGRSTSPCGLYRG